jgi:hypothetical protein
MSTPSPAFSFFPFYAALIKFYFYFCKDVLDFFFLFFFLIFFSIKERTHTQKEHKKFNVITNLAHLLFLYRILEQWGSQMGSNRGLHHEKRVCSALAFSFYYFYLFACARPYGTSDL